MCLLYLTSFLPDVFVFLHHPAGDFSILPFFSVSHSVLPAKFEGIPSCFSEYFDILSSPNLNSGFVDLYSKFNSHTLTHFALPGFGILTTLGSNYADYICKLSSACEISRRMMQE